MSKAVIIYNSKTGITKKYAKEIAAYLSQKKIAVNVLSITDAENKLIAGADYLFLGCWTNGLFLFLQHPDKLWKDFASKLPDNLKAKTALFTTYKVLTGSMFANMRKLLNGKVASCSTELKSRDGKLSESDKLILDQFIH